MALYKALRDKAVRRPESIGNEGVINSTKLLLTGKYAYPFVRFPFQHFALLYVKFSVILGRHGCAIHCGHSVRPRKEMQVQVIPEVIFVQQLLLSLSWEGQ